MSRLHTLTTPTFGARAARLAAVAGLFGAACLAGPISAAAQATVVHHHHLTRKLAYDTKETVEDRITSLHGSLMITPDEETKWAAVAQVMRDNESDMQRMISERRAAPPHEVTAVEDLKTYEHFTQAHVNGLKNLIASFETLYAVMPTPQQAVADTVFAHFGGRDRSLKS